MTNTNFEHFWLNEGFTVFTERKIASRMKGETTRHFSAINGWKDLKEEVCNKSLLLLIHIFVILGRRSKFSGSYCS